MRSKNYSLVLTALTFVVGSGAFANDLLLSCGNQTITQPAILQSSGTQVITQPSVLNNSCGTQVITQPSVLNSCGTQVLTQPAVLDNACGNQLITQPALLDNGCGWNSCGSQVLTQPAILGNNCNNLTGASVLTEATRRGRRVFDLSLFGFGIHVGGRLHTTAAMPLVTRSYAGVLPQAQPACETITQPAVCAPAEQQMKKETNTTTTTTKTYRQREFLMRRVIRACPRPVHRQCQPEILK